MAKAKSKKAKQNTTAVFVEKYKGKKTFSIWNVDEDGDKVGDYPLIAFGEAKAKALLKHSDELEEYVEALEAASEDDDDEEEPPRKAKKKPKKVSRRSASSDDDGDSDDDE